MSTIDEVLAAAEVVNAVCVIDGETRIISVPNEYKELGVESDEKVTRVKFQCPKIVGDNIDLTEYNLYINYRNAGNKLNSYLVEDATVTGDTINFSWLLSRHVTESPGTINYIVCAKKSDDTGVINEWNTKVATGTVGIGLETTEEIEEQNIDAIEQILRSIVELENKVGGGSGGSGEDGGYYSPSVDAGGNLTWTASKTGMPAVDGANIKGTKGDKGADGKSAYQYAVEGGYTGTETEFAAKLASGYNFYIDLTGDYPNYTCSVAMDDIKAAYNSGYNLVCRCAMGIYTATLPLFVPMPNANVWLFSGSGALDGMGFEAQALTIAITANGVLAQLTGLATEDDKLPNPNALTFTGAVTGSYDGSAPLEVAIPSGGADCTIAVDVLASGTVVQGSEEPVDTGVTLGKLKEYKMFILSVSGVSNVSLHNWYTRLGTLSLSRVNNARAQTILYEFLNAEKTILMPIIGAQGNHSVFNNFAATTNSYGVSQTAAFPDCIYNLAGINNSTPVITYPVKSDAVDVNWSILGVVK